MAKTNKLPDVIKLLIFQSNLHLTQHRLPENLLLVSKVWMLIFDKTFDFYVILNQVMFKIIVIKLIDF